MITPAIFKENEQMSGILKLRNTLFGTKAFYRNVIMLVIPIVIQNTVTNVVSLLDNVMVGRVGMLEMSAVGIVNQLLLIFNLCIFGGISGAGIFSAQFAGARNQRGVRHCFRVKILTAVLLTAVAIGIFTALPNQLVSLYIAEDTSVENAAATLGFGTDYLGVMLVGLLPFALSQAYASTLRELGETKLPMIASAISIFVNLVFNYFLIFGKFGFPRLGVTGAAIATVLSRFVELIIIILFTHLKAQRFEFIKGAYRSIFVPKELLKDIIKRGSPLILNETMWSAGMAMLMQCYSVKGLEVVAACNISTTASNLFNVIFYSMGSAISIMVGQCLGANEHQKAKQTAYRLITFSVMTSVVMGSLLASLSGVIPLMYKAEPIVRDLASKLLIVVGLFMPVYSFAHGCYFTLRSGGRTVITTLFDSGYTWFICVPIAAVLAHLTPLSILPLYISVQCIDIIKCTLGFIFVKKGIWIMNIVENKNQPSYRVEKA